MSLITLQRSPNTNQITEPSNQMSIKSYFENKLSSPMAFADEAEGAKNSKQIDFDKEFNFHDLKEIYDENSSKAFLLKSSLNKPIKILKSASNVKVDSIHAPLQDNDLSKTNPQLYEKYFVVKDAALILPKRSNTLNTSTTSLSSTCSDKAQKTNLADNNNELSNDSAALLTENDSSSIDNRSLCRYQQRMEQKQKELDASQLVDETMEENKKLEEIVASDIDLEQSGDILVHLKSMIRLLRPTDTITVAVKLCSYYPNIVRYLVVVETPSSRPNMEFSCEESAILGLELQVNDQSDDQEANSKKAKTLPICSVGLVIPIYSNCEISLNGDGGFKFKTHQSTHIFKPVSIQAMWSAYQYLHKALENSRKFNFYSVVPNSYFSTNVEEQQQQNEALLINHEWVKHYTGFVGKSKVSEQQYLNEWYQNEDRTVQREEFTTPYFDQPCLTKEQEETGFKIKEKLKEIMISSKDDYGSMSSVQIRGILEKELQLNLAGFKKFVDVTIFQFYNQLIECASQILPFLYLGTEWNASNYDSLVSDGVTHILNMSSDVDNFFPDAFTYLNIRVKDVEETDLLKEFDRTNKFIQECRELGTGCLVHCKMGVSRSASVVLAYLMKEYNYNLEDAFNFTKQKRTCVNPNAGFRAQLVTYESILNAHRSKYSLFEPAQSQSQQFDSVSSSPVSTSALTDINIINNNNNGSCDSINKCTIGAEIIHPSLSVKDAINKIKSLSSTESHKTDASKSPKSAAIDINLKREVSYLIAPSELKSKSNENMCTASSSSLNTHDQLLNQKIPENSRSHQRSKSNCHRDQPRNPLNHTKSCSTEIFTCRKSDQSSKNVKKLAKQYMRKESQSLPNDMLVEFNFQENNEAQQKMSARFSLNLNVLNNEAIPQVSVDEPPVPIGIVKRQVESINFKSRPCTSNQNNLSVNLDENTRGSSNEYIAIENRKSFLVIDDMPNPETFKITPESEHTPFPAITTDQTFETSNCTDRLQIVPHIDSTNELHSNKQLQQQAITRSPDCKRFKWELLGHEQNIDSFSGSKKVFEFLADKQRKHEQDSLLERENQGKTSEKKVIFLDVKPLFSTIDEKTKSPSTTSSILSNSVLLNINNAGMAIKQN